VRHQKIEADRISAKLHRNISTRFLRSLPRK
jgi:hypothetical protein